MLEKKNGKNQIRLTQRAFLMWCVCVVEKEKGRA